MIEIKNPYAKELCKNKSFNKYIEDDEKMFGTTRNPEHLNTIIKLGATVAGLRYFFSEQDFHDMVSNMLESYSK